MTIECVIDLLKTERECVRRASNDICDRQCEKCVLVQDSEDLLTMYDIAIALLSKK